LDSEEDEERESYKYKVSHYSEESVLSMKVKGPVVQMSSNKFDSSNTSTTN
jgi:hypothetical protein